MLMDSKNIPNKYDNVLEREARNKKLTQIKSNERLEEERSQTSILNTVEFPPFCCLQTDGIYKVASLLQISTINCLKLTYWLFGNYYILAMLYIYYVTFQVLSKV